jgi:hypothetical protein
MFLGLLDPDQDLLVRKKRLVPGFYSTYMRYLSMYGTYVSEPRNKTQNVESNVADPDPNHAPVPSIINQKY